jgi:site-specific DNA-adenine methylase
VIKETHLRPMFSYMGSKWRIAKLYGRPSTNLVIEPFAGAACYSLYWNAPKVLLYDLNPIVAGVWKYLTKVKESEICKGAKSCGKCIRGVLCTRCNFVLGLLEDNSRFDS